MPAAANLRVEGEMVPTLYPLIHPTATIPPPHTHLNQKAPSLSEIRLDPPTSDTTIMQVEHTPMGSNLFLQKGGENILSEVALVLLVGLDHHGNMDLDRFQDSITLEAEPHNPHDSEAIVAKVNSITVGHVCRSHTARVHSMLSKLSGGRMSTMLLRYVDYHSNSAELLVGISPPA